MTADRRTLGKPLRRVACSCDRCRAACHTVPGWFGSLAEVRRAAKHLGMAVDTFVRTHCVVDWHLNPAPLAVGVARQDDVDEGRMEAGGPETGACSMLGPDGCRLPLGVRPVECAAYTHDGPAVRPVLAARWARKDQGRLRRWMASERLPR
jgi:hypothetical protein